ncbi:MAG: hypothetical protein NVSMB19_08350 [Vulcanimicrobiaceae bacterium]
MHAQLNCATTVEPHKMENKPGAIAAFCMPSAIASIPTIVMHTHAIAVARHENADAQRSSKTSLG